jgi:hypothetical protein
VHFSAGYTELPMANPLPDRKDLQSVWLHADFSRPIVAAGREAFLMLPAMSRKAVLLLNGIPLKNPDPGHPWAVKLTGLLQGQEEQHLAIEMPLSALGRPLFPVCLASAPAAN